MSEIDIQVAAHHPEPMETAPAAKETPIAQSTEPVIAEKQTRSDNAVTETVSEQVSQSVAHQFGSTLSTDESSTESAAETPADSAEQSSSEPNKEPVAKRISQPRAKAGARPSGSTRNRRAKSKPQAAEGKPESAEGKSQPAEKAQRTQANRAPRHVGLIALPVAVSQLIKKHGVTHPGLVLDKYAVLLQLKNKRLHYEWDAEQKQRVLQKVAHLQQTQPELKKQWHQENKRRRDLLVLQGSQFVALRTRSPILFERHHPLANLGLELHPILGFPVISGHHIKGRVRQYVEANWLPAQADQSLAQAQIESVFGKANGKGGVVCFETAWPRHWPQLRLEYMNSHHPGYYENQEAPGDWQEPHKESMLALASGSEFEFVLSPLRPDSGALGLATEWLETALLAEGLGAYRSLGLGAWETLSETSPDSAKTPDENSLQAVLQLSSPAFLGGSKQVHMRSLRPQTLKGLLRWWWRTMYAGFLSTKDLLSLEAAIWGSGKNKTPFQISLETLEASPTRRYQPDETLKRLPRTEGDRRSPGLTYLGYGLLNDGPQRTYLEPGAQWQLSIQVKDTRCRHRGRWIDISAKQVQEQIQAAIWLLCQYGGLGQRKRKAFGSLQAQNWADWNLDHVKALAASLLKDCQLEQVFNEDLAMSPSLAQTFELEIATPWKNVWFVMHELGESLQEYMQAHKHELEKKALGLPRPMKPPLNGEFPVEAGIERHASPYHLHIDRTASGQFSIRMLAFPAARLPNLAQSQKVLQELAQALQTALAERIELWPEDPHARQRTTRAARPEGDAAARAARPARSERPVGPRPERSERPAGPRPERPAGARDGGNDRRPPKGRRSDAFDSAPVDLTGPYTGGFSGGFSGDKGNSRRKPEKKAGNAAGSGLPQNGQWVEATLLEEKTKKGGWRAQEVKSKISGPLLNSTHVSGESEAGQKIPLMVHASNRFEIIFRWPTEAELAKRPG